MGDIKSFASMISDSFLRRFPRPICRFLLSKKAEYASFLPEMYVRIETTNACNAKCDFCTHDVMKRSVGFMDYSLSEKIINECAKLKISTIWFMGFGEPLLDKILEDRIKYAKQMGIKNTAVITNGALLTEERALSLIKAGLDEINISLDAASKENYEERRIKLSYETVTGNIKNLMKLRKKMDLLIPRVTLSFIKTKDNRNELSDFIRQWKPVVDYINVSAIHNWGVNFKNIKKRYNIPCYRLWFTFVILWNGLVSLCCADVEGDYILGDVKTSGISEIWNNEKYRRIRIDNLKLSNPPGCICSNCSLTDRDNLLWLKNLI